MFDNQQPRFAAASARFADHRDAARAVVRSVQARAGTRGNPDLVFLFLTADHRDAAAEILQLVRSGLEPAIVVGGVSESVVGSGIEIERAPGISALAAWLPPTVTLTPFAVPGGDERVPRGALPDAVHTLIVFGDPLTTPAIEFLDILAAESPELLVVGGMVSSGKNPRDNRLFCDDRVVDSGMVCLGIGGTGLRLESVFSSGCEPIGQPLRVTDAEGTHVRTLRYQPAVHMTHQVLSELSEDVLARLEHGLYLGIVIDEYKPEFGRGDFLVRSLVGVDGESLELIVADQPVRAGQTVQFHLRDAETAADDLRILLADHAESTGAAPLGALLVTCVSRGTRLFAEPNQDAGTVADTFPGLPIAGFFAAREIAPIGGRSHLFTQAAAVLLFYPETEVLS